MFDLLHLIQSVSYAGIFGMVFAESGLLAGFFLPGDSLLITAGLLAKQGTLNLPGLMLVVAAGVILGDGVGYAIGRKFGPAVFNREGSRLLRPKYAQRTQAFFDRHGSRALILARFVPVVRTAAPTMAGVGGMSYPKFLTYNQEFPRPLETCPTRRHEGAEKEKYRSTRHFSSLRHRGDFWP
ncbi:DedA family protein [Deinococcus depolymerans]|uniref:VTT domain-containing protein n=1 Tax=Deinococcus depolymerans TaxID=392408 RepID=A0ABN1BPJ2_9DEIO